MNNAKLIYLKMQFQPQKLYGAELHLKTIFSILYVHTRRNVYCWFSDCCLRLKLKLSSTSMSNVKHDKHKIFPLCVYWT
jgi:hypothetical protein